MDRLVQRTASVAMYVCAPRIKEAVPFSLEKNDHIYLTRIPMWRRNWQTAVTARCACTRVVITTVIVGVGQLRLHVEESATVHHCMC